MDNQRRSSTKVSLSWKRSTFFFCNLLHFKLTIILILIYSESKLFLLRGARNQNSKKIILVATVLLPYLLELHDRLPLDNNATLPHICYSLIKNKIKTIYLDPRSFVLKFRSQKKEKGKRVREKTLPLSSSPSK